MNPRKSLIQMLRQLLEDTLELHQQGAGYYSCVPVARRFNKLLEQARRLFPESDGLINTFDELNPTDPKDPADKMIELQGFRIEIQQLISLLESLEEEPSGG